VIKVWSKVWTKVPSKARVFRWVGDNTEFAGKVPFKWPGKFPVKLP